MTPKRKQEKPWGAMNLAVNLSRLLVDLIRMFWHTTL